MNPEDVIADMLREEQYRRLMEQVTSPPPPPLGGHFHAPQKPKKHRGIDINKQALKTLYTSPAQATNDDDDLVEVLVCRIGDCNKPRYTVEGDWGSCKEHMPNFDAVFTLDEFDVFNENISSGSIAVGVVRHIKQLELMVENLQEQIIELSKGDR